MNTKNFMKDIYCLTGCIFLFIFDGIVPGLKIFGLICSIFSGGLLASDFYRDKWRMLFINLGLFNAEKKTPILIKKSKNDLGDKYIFKLPDGICLTDFKKCKEDIETVLHKSINITLNESYNLMIQIFNVEYKSVYKPNYEVGKEIKQ